MRPLPQCRCCQACACPSSTDLSMDAPVLFGMCPLDKGPTRRIMRGASGRRNSGLRARALGPPTVTGGRFWPTRAERTSARSVAAIKPGLALTLAVDAINLLGDSLLDHLALVEGSWSGPITVHRYR